MKAKSKLKWLLSLMLCCTALAGLISVISMKEVKATEDLYYAENVGGMKRGTEVCYYTKTPDGELQRNFETSSNFDGKTLDAK